MDEAENESDIIIGKASKIRQAHSKSNFKVKQKRAAVCRVEVKPRGSMHRAYSFPHRQGIIVKACLKRMKGRR